MAAGRSGLSLQHHFTEARPVKGGKDGIKRRRGQVGMGTQEERNTEEGESGKETRGKGKRGRKLSGRERTRETGR